ncbi:gliding motility-associated C-terminal domain-containing protein [Spirosoma validum]|uniref:Gliding motility-associated C-terminal domain-containing protein n=1 Tax=Spirosoma validum TaxID=2771355 RepID=A0A927B2E4_9BACT|nr:gliding motility-associated C-terminal domain-containing protein [Spirosoma validum]MBD2753987.1 gliding motility-associated C-terminal domain-containing protein [Spirosoma validum]
MRTSTYRFIYWLLFLSLPLVSLATHQVGGQLEMQAIGDVPGHYRIVVTQYFEDGTPGIARQASTGSLGIFRKSNNSQMMTFTVTETGRRQPVIYANEFCAQQRNLKFVVSTYEATIQLAPSSYTDPQGYYISYQTRNRNSGINNIRTPDQVGFTFYLEFPALMQNGQLVSYSSPHFGPINGEYVCIGDAFTFPFGGTDPDGDQLRYSMVTPLDQKGTGMGSNAGVSPGPYPDVSWLSGFSATNAIPGSPTLSVNAQTGKLSVTATQLGLFVFAIKVEEYRNSVKIGEVRRDFQLLVIDCPPQTTPAPTVQLMNRPQRRLTTICQGDNAVLQATINNDWNYQWRRDGVNLSGATSSTLTVSDAGEYTVLVSPKATCSKAGTSDTLAIRVIGQKASLTSTGHLCAQTGSVTLTATADTGVAYKWYREGQALANPVTDSLKTTQDGRYWAVLTYTSVGCTVTTDTTSLVRSAPVLAKIVSASGQNRICPQDSLLLQSSGGLRYVWQKDGQIVTGTTGTQYRASKAGTYVVIATDTYGCEGTSPPLVVIQLPTPAVTLDSIPAVCGPNNPTYTLKGSPPGGDYTGTGLTGNTFDPKTAGVGDHKLSYGVKAAPECAATVVSQTAVVSPIPTIQLADTMTTYRGNTFTLNPAYTGNPNQFQWTSGQYLDNATSANPLITNIANDITYTLDVKNRYGCEAKDTIRITVYIGVWVPDAFSPNGDGVNDVWDLPGIEAFPDAIVTVFNRWGEVIYSSGKGYTLPFDGTLNGVSLPGGVYAYTVRTVPEKPVLRGRLMLVR